MSNKLVAVCDILGFTALVQNNSAETIANTTIDFLRKTLYSSLYQKNYSDGTPTLQELKNQNEIGLAMFSDTLLLYTLQDNIENNNKLIQTVAYLLFFSMFGSKFCRIRAGISYGEFYHDDENQLYLGKAIVDAYKLEKKQLWAGATLTRSAEEIIPDYAKKENNYEWWLTYYKVPLRSPVANDLNYLVIDWTKGFHNPSKFNWSESNSEPSLDECKRYKDIIDKWKNIRKFHSEKCLRCKDRF
jgi:hypothetical protein